MGKKETMQQMIDVHKTSFDNFFSAMVLYQNQAEKLLKNFVEKTPGISDEGKKVIDQWCDVYKKGIDNFKKAIDDGYTQIETLLDLDAVFLSQDQTEKMLSTFICQQNLVPKNYFKDVMREWISMYNKNMKNVEELFSKGNDQ
jgi:hypothetical protein